MIDTFPHDTSGGAAAVNTVRGRSGSTVGPSGSHYIIGPLQKASGPRKKEKTAMSHFGTRTIPSRYRNPRPSPTVFWGYTGTGLYIGGAFRPSVEPAGLPWGVARPEHVLERPDSVHWGPPGSLLHSNTGDHIQPDLYGQEQVLRCRVVSCAPRTHLRHPSSLLRRRRAAASVGRPARGCVANPPCFLTPGAARIGFGGSSPARARGGGRGRPSPARPLRGCARDQPTSRAAGRPGRSCLALALCPPAPSQRPPPQGCGAQERLRPAAGRHAARRSQPAAAGASLRRAWGSPAPLCAAGAPAVVGGARAHEPPSGGPLPDRYRP